MSALVPMLVESVVTLSTKVAVDSLVKMTTPVGVRAVNGFIIKAGSLLVGAFLANQLSKIAVSNTEAIIATVNKTPEAVETDTLDS